MKKATVEFTQGAVVYLVLMLVVIVIGVAIVTKGQWLFLLDRDKFMRMFDSSQIDFGSGATFSASCNPIAGGTLIYDMRVKNVAFKINDPEKKLGDNIDFYLILNFQNSIMTGRYLDENGNPQEKFSCRLEAGGMKCSNPPEIIFNIAGTSISNNELLHITAWRATAGVNEFVRNLNSNQVYGDLVNGNSDAFLGALSVAGKVGIVDICARGICDKCGNGAFNICDRNECEGFGLCYFSPYIPNTDTGGACISCKDANSCSDFNQIDCSRCGSYRNCAWNSDENKCVTPGA